MIEIMKRKENRSTVKIFGNFEWGNQILMSSEGDVFRNEHFKESSQLNGLYHFKELKYINIY